MTATANPRVSRSPRLRLTRALRGVATPAALLIAPMVLLAFMVFWPLLQQIWISLTDARLTNPGGGSFVGLENFEALMAGTALPQVLANTLAYTLGSTGLALVMGTLAALVVNTRFRGHGFVKGVLASPWAIPPVAAASIWLWMFSESRGIFNRIIEGAGGEPVAWLTSEPWAMVSVILVTAWQFAPLVMLVTLSALKSVPDEVAEASRVDGASAVATFTWVVWPHILPTFRLLGILLVIESLRRWDIIAVMTGGGPVMSTSTIVVAIQRQAFQYQEVGMGAAYAMIGITLAVIFALAYLMVERRAEKRNGR
ncbi:carbohydrate ABC transporter permease [Demequina zhanjiangensis]|uniref:Sugar ABC transporter permease n=1 Tax=Demequina zhanjiangensis TaxID=3051659 RepID=A0ABT8FZG5_9MICO|nr:sugar ABC transporter permease [Demequina sp. SYSU T00b26]MDN4472247.1 sugar ABC transporter permease [Demequina sp. SYSU T00b26]